MYAHVLIEIKAKQVDKLFIYKIPDFLKEKVLIGVRVKINFNGRILEGFVMDIISTINVAYNIKSIVDVVDEQAILNKEMLELGDKLAKKYLVSRIVMYQGMLPKALRAKNNSNISVKMQKYIKLNKNKEFILSYINKNKRYYKQIEVLTKLLKTEEILISSVSSCLKTLLKNELIIIEERECYRYNFHTKGTDQQVILTSEQERAINEVIHHQNENITYLLYGVTGSGKTEVYMQIIANVLKNGKEAILLVPEISLTTQIINRFKNRFGEQVAIIHSGLSEQEKYDEYRKIIRQEVRIVIGARSAIFAPLTNIGVIIIDEEHETTYKQENNPKYHARDVAILRSDYHHCPVVLGSATPSLESQARALKHVYHLLTLPTRANKKAMPKVTIVDMKEEMKKNKRIFSQLLENKIHEKLKNQEQIILLLNKRGYSSMVSCHDCGYVMKCPNCDISLTYHLNSNVMKCHYCGYATYKIKECPTCHSHNIKNYGLGTEQVEEIIKTKFSLAKVIRMDFDTTKKRGSHQKILDDFGEEKYNILLGTQMIAKGLDFPNVTLVGVINADTALNVPDFRSSERNFQLLSQVSGRAGRDQKTGEVIIQTFNPTHYSIVYASKHNYDHFFQKEMSIRKILKYSPYYNLILIRLTSKYQELNLNESNLVKDYLVKNLNKDLIILGPAPANMFKVNNIYTYQIIIKYRCDPNLEKCLLNLNEIYKLKNNVNLDIDINPIRL